MGFSVYFSSRMAMLLTSEVIGRIRESDEFNGVKFRLTYIGMSLRNGYTRWLASRAVTGTIYLLITFALRSVLAIIPTTLNTPSSNPSRI
jgi:hypothetical protein